MRLRPYVSPKYVELVAFNKERRQRAVVTLTKLDDPLDGVQLQVCEQWGRVDLTPDEAEQLIVALESMLAGHRMLKRAIEEKT